MLRLVVQNFWTCFHGYGVVLNEAFGKLIEREKQIQKVCEDANIKYEEGNLGPVNLSTVAEQRILQDVEFSPEHIQHVPHKHDHSTCCYNCMYNCINDSCACVPSTSAEQITEGVG